MHQSTEDALDAAFQAFVARAAIRCSGRTEVQEPIATSEVRSYEIHVEEAGLRLAYNAQTATLTLEVTHGPPAGKPAGWLVIFKAIVGDGAICDEYGITLESAVDYGLDLLCP
jgi:hypothetical protein